MKIIQRFIPRGHGNRPGYYMDPKYITVHNTANTDRGADAELHSRYIDNPSTDDSWHFTVDDHSIYQHLPLNENGWHAGDGAHGTGNRQSIGIELCENEGNDFDKTIQNAIWLIRKLMKDHNIPLSHVVPHKHWSGKHCPRLLLDMWGTFKDMIKGEVNHHEPEEPKVDSVEIDKSGSFIGKRVEAIVNNIDFYDRPTWNDKHRVGQIDKGWGFPEIVAKVTVDGSDQYKVKNSKGDVYYITAHSKYVKLEGEGHKPKPKPEKSGIQVLGHIEIVNVSHAAYICDRPSSTNSKNLDTAKRGSTWPIAGSVPGWYEIIYKGRRAYVNAKYGKRV